MSEGGVVQKYLAKVHESKLRLKSQNRSIDHDIGNRQCRTYLTCNIGNIDSTSIKLDKIANITVNIVGPIYQIPQNLNL